MKVCTMYLVLELGSKSTGHCLSQIFSHYPRNKLIRVGETHPPMTASPFLKYRCSLNIKLLSLEEFSYIFTIFIRPLKVLSSSEIFF